MAQADYSIANQGFPATRAEINSTLEAIATNNSGTTAPATQFAGQFWIDTTTSTWTLYIHDGTDDIQFATIDTSANTINFTDSALDVVTDTTPQLGGMLDVNGQSIGDGTLELIKFSETASAVNEITVTNSATGNAPEISATGDDTDIDLKLTPKGDGNLVLDGIEFPNADGTADQVLKTDGSGVLSFGSAGKVLQVVSTTSDSSEAINSQSFTELTSLTTSITPSSASSKILILGRVAFVSTTGGTNSFAHFRLRRNSTDICQGAGASGNMVNVTATGISSDNDVMQTNVPFTFLDSPNTTSAISYKIMGANWTGGGASGFTINRPVSPDGQFYNGFVTSTLTVIEIA